MNQIKKILVVSRSTSTCGGAVSSGIFLAKQLGAKLYVYQSDYHPFDLEGWGLPIPSLHDLRETYLETLEKDRLVLNKMIKEEKGPDVTVEILVNQKPMMEEVTRIVHDEGIDLLIMTSFEEGRLEHLLFSSSINEIVRTMPCSVMLVKGHRSWEA